MTSQLHQDLARVSRDWRHVAGQAGDLAEHRDRLILEAVAHGTTHAEVARLTGLTRSRIGQIALTREGRRAELQRARAERLAADPNR